MSVLLSLFFLLSTLFVCFAMCLFSLFTLLLFIRGSIFVFDFILFFYQCFPNYISNNNNNTFNNFFFLLFANGLRLFPRTNVSGSHVTFPPCLMLLLLFCSNPSTRWNQTYSLLTGCQRPRVSPTDDSSI